MNHYNKTIYEHWSKNEPEVKIRVSILKSGYFPKYDICWNFQMRIMSSMDLQENSSAYEMFRDSKAKWCIWLDSMSEHFEVLFYLQIVTRDY